MLNLNLFLSALPACLTYFLIIGFWILFLVLLGFVCLFWTPSLVLTLTCLMILCLSLVYASMYTCTSSKYLDDTPQWWWSHSEVLCELKILQMAFCGAMKWINPIWPKSMSFHLPDLCCNGCVELSDIKLCDGRPAEVQQYSSTLPSCSYEHGKGWQKL